MRRTPLVMTRVWANMLRLELMGKRIYRNLRVIDIAMIATEVLLQNIRDA